METQAIVGRSDGPNYESNTSGVHWASILVGAAAAAALSLTLIPLGSALGFSSFSVFDASRASAVTFGAGWAVWLVIMQWVSSSIGGYLAGRLRVKWADLHSDEVFFRDTAHGFLAWAVATIVTLGIVGAIGLSNVSDAGNYYADRLYRGAASSSADAVSETGRILANDAGRGLSTDDRNYIARQVAVRTGLSPSEAEARVNATLSDIEKARKATVSFSIILFLSLVLGAFIASVCAAIGGRARDRFDSPQYRNAPSNAH